MKFHPVHMDKLEPKSGNELKGIPSGIVYKDFVNEELA